MKLNLGSNTKIFPGWTNVDRFNAKDWAYTHAPERLHEFNEWFICSDLNQFLSNRRSECADAIAMIHVLDHLTYSEARQALMSCSRVLKPGGVLRVVVEDLEVFLEAREAGTMNQFADGQPSMYQAMHPDIQFAAIVFGSLANGSAYTGHKMIYTLSSLDWMLEANGFPTQEVVAYFNDPPGSMIEDWEPWMDTQPGHSIVVEVKK